MKRKPLMLFNSVCAFFLAALLIGNQAVIPYRELINNTFGLSTTKLVETGEAQDTQYWKSEFGELNEENQKKLVEAGFEQGINEMKEGAALLTNVNNALPLDKNTESVSFFGHASADPFFYGVSAGSRPNAGYNPSVFDAMKDDGFRVNEELMEILKNTETTRGTVSPWGNLTEGHAAGTEDPISVYDDAAKATWANDYNDVAIYIIARQGSESSDMLVHDSNGRSSMALTDEEIAILEMLRDEKSAGHFSKIVVLLNTASQLEVDWLDDYDVDACLFVGCLGAQGARGVSSILSGETNPSGHLVDTYAVDSTSAPAVVNSIDNTPAYENAEAIDAELDTPDQASENASHMTFQAEGIYIGYKYYETRYEDSVFGVGNANGANGASRGATEWKYENEIVFPFGHGLSYTTFEQTLDNVEYDSDNDLYRLTVTVKNTGDVAGKSVVQVYAQTPYGDYEKENKVEKSAVTLVGFNKTQMLEPGSSETVTVEVDRYLLASYDYIGAKTYILSGGDYYLAIGDDAHDALNNIIKAKDPDVENLINYDGTAAEGNLDKTYHFVLSFDDETYSTSSTGVEITNLFDDCDLNYWVPGAGVYLSRSDWNGTYPTQATTVTATDEMIEVLSGDLYEKPEDSPTLEEATADLGQDAGLKFVDMKDVAWDDDETWEKYLKQMTLDELMSTLQCQSGRTGVNSVVMPDSKVGDGCDGVMGTYPYAYEDTTGKYGSGRIEAGAMNSTRYSSKTILTMTFNTDLYQRRGELMGEDGLWCGFTETWCIGADLHRTPFCGRAYEYCSEDANMTYLATIPEVIGMESKGMLAGIKHFAGNDQETERHGVSVFFNEQAWRENSLRAFEGGIRVAKATSLMQSFNRIGLLWASASSALNEGVCLGEWGFEGHLETDGTDNATAGFMSHYATTLVAGSDTYCLNSTAAQALKEQMVATDDGNLVQYVLRAAKHFHYAMSRSNLTNGLSSTTEIVSVTPMWLTALYVSTGTAAVLLVAGLIVLTAVKRKEGKEIKEAQA